MSGVAGGRGVDDAGMDGDVFSERFNDVAVASVNGADLPDLTQAPLVKAMRMTAISRLGCRSTLRMASSHIGLEKWAVTFSLHSLCSFY